MSLTPAKMGNSLKDQLAQEERDLKAELAANAKDQVRAAKVEPELPPVPETETA